MNHRFDATREFEASLDTIGLVANSLMSPEALRPANLSVTNSMCCACVVLLSGYFESYLKSLIKEYIESINSLGLEISNIPFAMQLLHYSGGADALQFVARQDKGLNSTLFSQDLSARLGSLRIPVGYTLAWESFANTKSNPGAKTVSDLLAGIDVKGGWTALNELCKTYGRLDTFLDAFIKVRNICAHTGRHSTPPSGLDLKDYSDRFLAISECMDTLVAIRLDDFGSS